MNFTRNIYKTANRYTSLIVKKDLWSECFAKKNNDPNITARKEWFKAGNYLGGYFTDYATVGHDITALALDQHEGKAKMNLSRTHTPQKHLDYEKMKMLGLNYSDYSDDYVITNAPMYKSQPVLLSSSYQQSWDGYCTSLASICFPCLSALWNRNLTLSTR